MHTSYLLRLPLAAKLVVLALLVAALPASLVAADEGLRLRSVGRTVYGRLHPGGWLAMTVTIGNTSTEEMTARVSAGFAKFPDIQSARVAKIPPQSDERVEISIFVPPAMVYEQGVEVEVMLYNITSKDGEKWEEVLASADGVPQQSSMPVSVEQTDNMLATYLSPEPPLRLRWQWPGRTPNYNYEFVVAGRVHGIRSRTSIGFESISMPLLRTDWHDMSMLIISDARAFDDAATVVAIQQFVNEGGRLWLMLDRIPTHYAELFLGNGQSISELDVVELNSFDVKLNLPIYNYNASDLHWDGDEPANFKRVMQNGGKVTHLVDGWPAAIWMKSGYGEVLCTTLEDFAWLTPGSESPDPVLQTNFRVRPFASALAMYANEPRYLPPIHESTEYPLNRIGNPVLPRSWIMTVLFSFLAVLIVGALASLTLGRLSQVGWIAPGLSALVGALLVLNSAWVRVEIPETHTKLQLVQVGEQGRAALVREQGALYLSNERELSLTSNSDGFALADENIQTGIKQYAVESHHQWQLRNMAWPPGVSRYQAQMVVDTNDAVAIGELSSEGLSLKLPESFSKLQDPVIAFAPGRPMIGKLINQQVLADGSLMAAEDRWVADSLISDEQQRRISVYQAFFSDEDHNPPRSSLLGWTDTLPSLGSESSDFNEVGAALVNMPIRLLRPQLGKSVLVPAGMLRLAKDIRDAGHTSAYDDISGKWSQDMSYGLNAGLQFVLPNEVVPFQAESVELQLSIRAPKRIVRVLAGTRTADSFASSDPSAGLVEIVRLESPTVPWSGTITDPSVLAGLRDGILDVTLEISERTDAEPNQASSLVTWRLDAFNAQVRGSRTGYGSELK